MPKRIPLTKRNPISVRISLLLFLLSVFSTITTSFGIAKPNNEYIFIASTESPRIGRRCFIKLYVDSETGERRPLFFTRSRFLVQGTPAVFTQIYSRAAGRIGISNEKIETFCHKCAYPRRDHHFYEKHIRDFSAHMFPTKSAPREWGFSPSFQACICSP